MKARVIRELLSEVTDTDRLEGMRTRLTTVYWYDVNGACRQVYYPTAYDNSGISVVRLAAAIRYLQQRHKDARRQDVRDALKAELRRLGMARKGKPSAPVQKSFLDRVRGLPLTPKSYLYDRAVGVELECFGPEITDDSLPFWARAKSDSSIRPTHGLQCPVEVVMLSPRGLLEVRLHKICQLLKNHEVNKSCGLHVHLDARKWTEAEAMIRGKRLQRWLVKLIELVPESRRSNDYCRLTWDANDRYRAVNWTAYRKHQTIEVRLHSGTVDFTKIIAWIRLLELLMAINPPPPARSKTTLEALAALPLADHDRAYWLARHRALNPPQYTGGETAREGGE